MPKKTRESRVFRPAGPAIAGDLCDVFGLPMAQESAACRSVAKCGVGRWPMDAANGEFPRGTCAPDPDNAPFANTQASWAAADSVLVDAGVQSSPDDRAEAPRS